MSRLRPWHIALVFYLFYLGFILIRNNGDPRAFAKIGNGPNEGYDGQFVYFIAIDPAPDSVIYQVQTLRSDLPAYRYQRILLPLLARIVGLGQPSFIAWALPIINLMAQLVGVAIVERLLLLLNVSRWHALLYGLYPGLAVAVRADLTEPLAYTLVVAAFLLHSRERPWLSALCFGLALLAKETVVVFIGGQILYFLFNRQWKQVGLLTLLTILPFLIWQVVLRSLFGSFGLGSGGYLGTSFEIIPFNGVWQIASTKGLVVFIVFLLFLGPWVMFPAIWGIIASVRQLFQRNWHPYVWALAANAAFIPFTPFSTFREPVAIFRFCVGLVLATLLFGGLVHSRRVLNYSWFWLVMLVFLRE